MDVKTKYDINDNVWYIHPTSEKAVCGKIIDISVKIKSKPIYQPDRFGRRSLIKTGDFEPLIYTPTYILEDSLKFDGVTKSELEVFESKEKLKEHYLNKINSL